MLPEGLKENSSGQLTGISSFPVGGKAFLSSHEQLSSSCSLQQLVQHLLVGKGGAKPGKTEHTGFGHLHEVGLPIVVVVSCVIWSLDISEGFHFQGGQLRIYVDSLKPVSLGAFLLREKEFLPPLPYCLPKASYLLPSLEFYLHCPLFHSPGFIIALSRMNKS